MKGLSSCHIPNDKYREGYDRIFGVMKNVKIVTTGSVPYRPCEDGIYRQLDSMGRDIKRNVR